MLVESSEQRILNSIHHHLWITCFAVLVLVVGFGGWIISTQISGVVVATGTIVVESNTKQVQHRDGGVVREVKVKNGDLVNIGDVLIYLDDTVVLSNQHSVIEQLGELYVQQARLIAEKDDLNELILPVFGENSPFYRPVKVAGEDQIRLFEARRNSLTGQRLQLQEQVDQLRERITGLQAERDAKSEEVKLVIREIKDIEPLLSKKFIERGRITELQREKAQLQGEHSSLVSDIAQDREIISERKLQILQLDEDVRADILQQLQDVRINIARLEREKIEIEDQLQRLEVRAPHSGFVHDLSVHTTGGVISAGETMMLLVPEKDTLLVEAQIRPVDIEQLQPGQETRIRLSSFDQRTTPELQAKLKTLSADLLQDKMSGAMFYQARFTIIDDEIRKLNGKSLIPGMPVEVFAKTEDRTILSYLLKPIVDQVYHAFRER